ncbi:acetyl-CoA carboxylase carboxyl transferase subunit beta [Bombilactobacillus folatiphilus]|uniref:Acetyl-coenzyme A carboxylase carboxyl transferase subunit beta n=1 Tax=Bombilactobacillus folatiphilus TaxID=2923362 RepID=A0ABY4P8Z5_9LACO|nr:acetyl-CoA carboxylase carboxyltransferase subunit beta [Bombilactobacillus folatiphilus]UQS82049.1 acetyl-CoA carboxylase carboxyl transferase subunit beta [Bombilactobacillus folatiphilus]
MSENHFAPHPSQALNSYHQNVPRGIFRYCPHCGLKFYFRRAGKYQMCPECGYGFRVNAHQRLKMLTKVFEEWDKDVTTTDPLDFPDYQDKLRKARSKTKLSDSVLTGKAQIKDHEVALGIMDPNFIMGSLGTATGERLTRLFEQATQQQLPVVLLTASGGARMQEGIHSLMQMAKVSQAVNAHRQAGLLYIVILMDPTTGGVTASFASQADITLAEPKALLGFAGRRVIEQTINRQLPPDFQSVENAYQNGFIDALVPRTQQVAKLDQLLTIFEAQKWGGFHHE